MIGAGGLHRHIPQSGITCEKRELLVAECDVESVQVRNIAYDKTHQEEQRDPNNKEQCYKDKSRFENSAAPSSFSPRLGYRLGGFGR